MTTSGVYTQAPDVAGFIDEAFERCGIDPAALTNRHLTSARRSLGFTFRDIENAGYHLRSYAIARETQALATGDIAFQLPAGTIDVLDVVYAEGDTINQPLARTDRYDYELLSNKETPGRPSMYVVTKEIPAELSYLSDTSGSTWEPGGVTGGGNYQDRPVLILWPAAQSASGTIIYYRVRYIQDAVALNESVDVARAWHNTVAAGLAKHLAVKFAPDRLGMLSADYMDAMKRASESDPNYGDTVISGRWSRRRRRI